MKRRNAETVAHEFMTAQLTSWVVNTGFRTTDKPTMARDFMPSEWAKRSIHSGKRKRMTKKRRAQLADNIRSMFPNWVSD